MGWQDRDWAKWTDEERRRFLGASTSTWTPAERPRAVTQSSIVKPGALLAIVVSLVGTVVLSGFPRILLLHRPGVSNPPRPVFQIVYGTGAAVAAPDGRAETCTQILNGVTCTEFTFVEPGQRVLRAAPLPPGQTCPLIEVDQARGAWVCANPPAPPAPPSVNS